MWANCPTAFTLACNVSFSCDEDRLQSEPVDLVLSRSAEPPPDWHLDRNLNDTWTYNSFAKPLSYVVTYGAVELFSRFPTVVQPNTPTTATSN